VVTLTRMPSATPINAPTPTKNHVPRASSLIPIPTILALPGARGQGHTKSHGAALGCGAGRRAERLARTLLIEPTVDEDELDAVRPSPALLTARQKRETIAIAQRGEAGGHASAAAARWLRSTTFIRPRSSLSSSYRYLARAQGCASHKRTPAAASNESEGRSPCRVSDPRPW